MDTATGLLAVIPILPRLHSEHPLISQALNLAHSSPEINKIVLIEADDGPDFYSDIADAANLAEKKEGDKYKMVVVLDPFSSITNENIMECFQRLIVDALADGIVSVNEKSRGADWDLDDDGYLRGTDLRSRRPLALWKRDVLERGFKTTADLRVIPYPLASDLKV